MGYLNLVYQPFKETDEATSGVMVLCHDVTELFLTKKRLEQSEEGFRNLVMQAPVAIAVFRGPDFIAEIANDAYLATIAKHRSDFVGKPFFNPCRKQKK